MNHENIPREKFTVIGIGKQEVTEALSVGGRGYFFDALSRFRKNKSSVIAAYIILFLVLYAILAPMLSPYKITDKDTVYTGYPPYIEAVSRLGIGLFDGGTVRTGQNETQLAALRAMGEETGMDPVIRIMDEEETVTKFRGEEKRTVTYKLRVNKYFETGVVFRVMSETEFQKIQEYQNRTGLQIIYPYVKKEDIGGITAAPNIWYKVSDSKGTPLYDSDDRLIPAYSTDKSSEGAPYDSLRIDGDDGNYIYSIKKAGALECRVCYYNYYIYANGHAPMFALGTNSLGQDLFSAIGLGARFSLTFALIVSAINLTVGMIYGAIQGYYGGNTDLVLDRIADILSGMPFIVVATLFQLHLAKNVGVVGSFLFAFVLTGWIGMAALTRKQFYRFKGQEFVLAARTLGASDGRLIWRHVFPNSLGTLVTSCALIIPSVISSETTFSYLGIINLSDFVGTSLGTLMSQGQTSMTAAPHAMLFPALYFSLLLISFNLFGNGLRDAFNPRARGVEE
ncbi:MAG: ABC transporter permease [Clostridia bacterium]|nr:ABC transporter permease [Clostridia bacterium]